LSVWNRELQIIHGAGRRGKVQHVIDRAGHIDEFRNVVLHDSESGISRQMPDVGFRSGHQVVDRQNFPAALKQVVTQVRSKKSRAYL